VAKAAESLSAFPRTEVRLVKCKVDILIINALVVTMDGTGGVMPRAAVAVDRGTILEIGDSGDLSARYEAGTTIDASDAIAMPGLINTHSHLATAMFRGAAEDMALGPWLQASWAREKAVVDRETIALSSRLAMLELIMGGVTCAVDMYWYPEVTASAAKKAGFRLAAGPVFIAGDDLPDRLSIAQRELLAREFVERFSGDPLIVPMLMSHSTLTDSPELLSRVKRLAEGYGVMVNLHSAETLAERNEVQARHGVTPVRLLRDLGILDGRTLLAHCVHVDDEEIAMLAGRAAVSHNPMSNLKLASGIAPLARMAEAGVRLSIGTDGALSGNDLNMWLAMRLCAVLQKCENGDATLFKAEDVVRMATIEAAKAIGLGDRIGSLEAGKRADIILIDLDSPHLTPLYDVYAQLLYAVGREDVVTVLIDGKIVMRDRRPTTIDFRESIDALKGFPHTIGRAILG